MRKQLNKITIALLATTALTFLACSSSSGGDGDGDGDNNANGAVSSSGGGSGDGSSSSAELPNLSGAITISPAATVEPNTELTAAYSGSETVSYQWKKDGVNVGGATSNKYTPTEVGSYTVTVSLEGYNSKTSAAVNVALPNLSGTITISPTANVETDTELTAAYSGSETVSYQWKKDGVNVGGATSNKYTPTKAGSYTVTVSLAGYNSKTSDAVTVVAYVVEVNGVKYSSLAEAVAADFENYEYTVFTVLKDIELDATITVPQNMYAVLVAGVDGVTISPAAGFQGALFSMEPGGQLILGDRDNNAVKPTLIIDGKKQISPLVSLAGNSLYFALYNGAELRNAREEGVYFAGGSGTEFYMYGGVIAGCAYGVTLSRNGYFIMEGGIIYGTDEGDNSNTVNSVLVVAPGDLIAYGTFYNESPPTSKTTTLGTAP